MNMKLGNTSQSNVPVPNFFLNKSLKQMETFEVSDRKRYFREKDLFRMTKDINFCNNPRNFNRKHDNFNKQKFVPDLTNINSILKSYSNTHYKKTHNQVLSPRDNTYENFRNFVQKTNVTNFTNPDLREEIKTNINVLIDRIKHDYDLNKWGSTDTRTNFINTNTDFNSGNNFNKNGFSYTKYDPNLNETDATRFKTILRDKVNNMSIDKNLKKKLVKNMDKYNDSTSDKFYKTKSTNIINKNVEKFHYNSTSDNESKEKLNLNYTNDKFTNMNSTYNNQNSNGNYLNSSHKPFIDINDNFNLSKICLPIVTNKYSTVSSNLYKNQNEIEKLKKENKLIYERFKDSNLFQDFPSPDRKEFVKKKGEKLRTKNKKDKIDKSIVDFTNYNASKHKSVFCEDYNTNEGIMLTYKKSKDVFV